MPMVTPEALATVAIGLLSVLVALLLFRGGRGARNAARARRLGKQGETRAKSLLLAAGYRIMETQATKALTILVDGREVTTHLRADFVLERRGRRYVADAKAGDKAPSPASAATRRQLLEYATAYDVDGVLLVDASRGKIHHVEFPALGKRARAAGGGASWILVAVLAGVLVYALALAN